MINYLDPHSSTLQERANALTRARVPFVLATVVRAHRKAPTRAGDMALLHADGWFDGFIGGASIDAAVRQYGHQVLNSNEPLLIRIARGDSLVPDDDGTVTVIEPALAGGPIDIFLEARRPAPRVVIVGESPVVRALVTIGGVLGFAVEVLDEAEVDRAPELSERDAAFIVVANGPFVTSNLALALRQGVPYVGLLGDGSSREAVLDRLSPAEDQVRRLHVPAGLDIGAQTPAEIAVALFGEVIAGRRPAQAPAGLVSQESTADIEDVEPAPHAEAEAEHWDDDLSVYPYPASTAQATPTAETAVVSASRGWDELPARSWTESTPRNVEELVTGRLRRWESPVAESARAARTADEYGSTRQRSSDSLAQLTDAMPALPNTVDERGRRAARTSDQTDVLSA